MSVLTLRFESPVRQRSKHTVNAKLARKMGEAGHLRKGTEYECKHLFLLCSGITTHCVFERVCVRPRCTYSRRSGDGESAFMCGILSCRKARQLRSRESVIPAPQNRRNDKLRLGRAARQLSFYTYIVSIVACAGVCRWTHRCSSKCVHALKHLRGYEAILSYANTGTRIPYRSPDEDLSLHCDASWAKLRCSLVRVRSVPTTLVETSSMRAGSVRVHWEVACPAAMHTYFT